MNDNGEVISLHSITGGKKILIIWNVLVWVWVRFKGCFMLDTRSLAFYRVVMGLTVIGDLIDRGRDLIMHYSDDGVAPRILVADRVPSEAYSLHLLSGAPEG